MPFLCWLLTPSGPPPPCTSRRRRLRCSAPPVVCWWQPQGAAARTVASTCAGFARIAALSAWLYAALGFSLTHRRMLPLTQTLSNCCPHRCRAGWAARRPATSPSGMVSGVAPRPCGAPLKQALDCERVAVRLRCIALAVHQGRHRPAQRARPPARPSRPLCRPRPCAVPARRPAGPR